MTQRDAAAQMSKLPPGRASELGTAGRKQVLAILTGQWTWSAVEGLPGRHRVARRLAALGWLVLWTGHPRGLHATLSDKGAEWLDVEVDEFPVVYWRTEGEGEEAITVDVLQDYDRWVMKKRGETPQERKKREKDTGYPMPRTRAIAELPIRDRFRAEPEPELAPMVDEDRFRALARACSERAKVSAERAAAMRPARVTVLKPGERRKILGVFVGTIGRGKRGKRKAGKKGKGRPTFPPTPRSPDAPASAGAGPRA
ncbi:MAG: hypothetical protein JWN86_719 [Planctomycetota bacterium]|nr:hypothetical protein [Planctomycetota bacterium]